MGDRADRLWAVYERHRNAVQWNEGSIFVQALEEAGVLTRSPGAVQWTDGRPFARALEEAGVRSSTPRSSSCVGEKAVELWDSSTRRREGGAGGREDVPVREVGHFSYSVVVLEVDPPPHLSFLQCSIRSSGAWGLRQISTEFCGVGVLVWKHFHAVRSRHDGRRISRMSESGLENGACDPGNVRCRRWAGPVRLRRVARTNVPGPSARRARRTGGQALGIGRCGGGQGPERGLPDAGGRLWLAAQRSA